MKNGKVKFDNAEFHKKLAFRVAIVSRYLKREPQQPDFTELAQILLDEKQVVPGMPRRRNEIREAAVR